MSVGARRPRAPVITAHTETKCAGRPARSRWSCRFRKLYPFSNMASPGFKGSSMIPAEPGPSCDVEEIQLGPRARISAAMLARALADR